MREQPRFLPTPASLEEAVDLVTQSNKADGYIPTRFMTMAKGKSGRELLQVCEHLITNGQTLEQIEKAFAKHPQLLTIEDFVAKFGRAWGFGELAVEMAQARTVYFNQLAKCRRYT